MNQLMCLPLGEKLVFIVLKYLSVLRVKITSNYIDWRIVMASDITTTKKHKHLRYGEVIISIPIYKIF